MEKLIEKINTALNKYMKIEYPEDIFKSMKYTTTLPGKRLRPVMSLEACRILGGNMEDAMPTACAIEMLHAQSLIHDDLPCMDNDDFRRGKPSNHKVFGEAIATLAGDALLSYGPQVIIENSKNIPAERVLKVLNEYMKAAGVYGIIAGIGSGIFWAIYLIASKKSMKKGNHTFTILLYSITFISIGLLPFTDFEQITNFISINPILVIIFLIMHSTLSFALPYIFSTLSLDYVDSGIVSILLSGVEPIAALIFGLIFYSEIPTLLMSCGFILNIISMMMLSRKEENE